MKNQSYTDRYYGMVTPGSLASARKVIPVVARFIQPHSVADIGCGAGAWLKTWQEQGVANVLGVDGYSGSGTLLIDPGNFIETDLEKPFQLPQKFDLVMSLEVAEHIRPAFAASFVHSLCQLGDVILFSAAIPGQGGVQHVNEQYPSYWMEIFHKNGFAAYDCIRPLIWEETTVDTCYRQNILLFVKNDATDKYPAITHTTQPVLSLVHPEHFQKKEEILQSYKNVLRTPFHAGWYFIKTFLRFTGILKPRK